MAGESRQSFAGGVDDRTLGSGAARDGGVDSRLDDPSTDAERAVAAALLIDGAGVRGLAERLSRSRREGSSVQDVVRNALADAIVPAWVPATAREWLGEAV